MGVEVSAALLLPLKNSVQSYAWGSTTQIPRLLGVPETGGPQAELWMGAHPKAPSLVEIDGRDRSLVDLIDEQPEKTLGADVLQRFGPRLPFLLKVLAVAEPLSLQAHPSPEQAAAGFARENAAGIAVDAPHRNYRDASAKPELISALTPFRALCGFRPWEETRALFEALGIAAPLRALGPATTSDDARIEALFRELMSLSPSDAQPLLDAACSAARDSAPLEYLASCATLLDLAKRYPGDVGALTSLMLNCMELKTGEAIYLPAGNLHAYLGGFGVEIMASSDNVLRGGLTPKHVDTGELLSTLVFHGSHIAPLPAPEQRARETRYATAAAEFALSRVDLRDGQWTCEPDAGPRIVLVTDGPVSVDDASQGRIERGRSVFVPPTPHAFTLRGPGTVFVASVPASRS